LAREVKLDPSSAAQYALIAISLVMIGAILTTGIVSIEQRAVALSGIIVILASIAWRRSQHHDGDPKE
jgi:hypothetical protein